jgi:hypothetical protein
MKALTAPAWLLMLGFVIPAAGQQYYYVRSNVAQPWGQTTNEDAMDNVFGSGNWTQLYYETLDPSVIFSFSNNFVFLEGGDSSYNAFASFMSTYSTSLNTWLQNGGRLVIMSAPNDPLSSATVNLPGSITLSADALFGSAASAAYATDVSNPIFSGPNSTAYYFTGDFFSHGYFTGSNVKSIMESNLGEVVLGNYVTGSGLMVYGGFTTDNFDLPQPAAHSLLENIIYYTAYTSLN